MTSKHYVQVSLTTVVAATSLNTAIAQGVKLADNTNGQEVTEGSVIKAVFVEMWVRTGDTAGGTALLTLVKTTEDGSISFAEQVALQDYNNKKNVLYHTQGLSNDQDADAIPFMRGWFKIPKGKQRFGLGDKLSLSIAAQALDQHVCGFMTYKEYK